MIYETFFDTPVGRLSAFAECDSLRLIRRADTVSADRELFLREVCECPMETAKYSTPTAKLSRVSGKSQLFSQTVYKPSLEIFLRVGEWIYGYFSDRRPECDSIPLNPSVSDFRRVVLSEISKIPYGRLVGISELTRSVGERLGGRRLPVSTVWAAIENNPLPLFIPCHRVVGDSGELRTYSLGLENKAKLLRIESVRNIFGAQASEKRELVFHAR